MKLFGFYTQCETCGKVSYQSFQTKPLIFMILTIVLFQIMTSLVLFPLLDWLIFSQTTLILVFTIAHILLLPFYWMCSVIFMVNSIQPHRQEHA